MEFKVTDGMAIIMAEKSYDTPKQEAIYNSIKDSGDRTVYSTGAQRDRRAGKGMFSLIPVEGLIAVAKHFEAGRVKYGDANETQLCKENWKKGMPVASTWDSAFRHLLAIKEGKTCEDHFSACIWNLFVMRETLRRISMGILPKELDNRDINEFENPRDLYEEHTP